MYPRRRRRHEAWRDGASAVKKHYQTILKKAGWKIVWSGRSGQYGTADQGVLLDTLENSADDETRFRKLRVELTKK